ncbi:MAG: hypothetical protein HY219_00855 [Candidatus Staskawiczbacteria bacterium]|nr:hypothetical protein [Candidatus Staskawiczbacteria bacterium]
MANKTDCVLTVIRRGETHGFNFSGMQPDFHGLFGKGQINAEKVASIVFKFLGDRCKGWDPFTMEEIEKFWGGSPSVDLNWIITAHTQ